MKNTNLFFDMRKTIRKDRTVHIQLIFFVNM